MTTQLDVWNMAAAHLGIKETIHSTDSVMLHAVTAAQFEQMALDIVLAEYTWGFANAEEALVIDNQEFTAIELTAVEPTPPQGDGVNYDYQYDSGDEFFLTFTSDLTTGLAAGDYVVVSGTIDGVEYEDLKLYVMDGVTKYVEIEYVPQG